MTIFFRGSRTQSVMDSKRIAKRLLKYSIQYWSNYFLVIEFIEHFAI